MSANPILSGIESEITKAKKRKSKKVKAPERETLFQQNLGSVPYGLPCLAVTRRTGSTSDTIASTATINKKLCDIVRNPGQFVNFSDSESGEEESESEEDEQDKAYMRLFKRN
jgi:hypothetical protein